jgi:BclA C-terminal domain
MKYVLGLLLCGMFICGNLTGEEYGSFSLSPTQSPYVLFSDNGFAFIPFSAPNINEFQVASEHLIANPSNSEIKVKKHGRYLISYSVAATHPVSSTQGSSEWITVLVVNGVSLNNTTTMGGTTSILNNRNSATGQTIVHLTKNSLVQLKITNNATGQLDVLTATIDFVKID